MKKALLRLSSLMLAALGFGVVSCDSITGGMDMYGSPTTDFSFKGKVTDASTAKAVQGIRVIVQDSVIYAETAMGPPGGGGLHYLRDTTYTDKNGQYTLRPNWSGLHQQSVRLFIESPTGDYRRETIDLPVESSDYKKSGEWRMKVEKNLDITLDPAP